MPNKYGHFIAKSKASLKSSSSVVNFYLGIDRIAHNVAHPYLVIVSYTHRYDEGNKTHNVGMTLKEVTTANTGDLYTGEGANPEIIFSINKINNPRGFVYKLKLSNIIRLGTTDPSEYAESILEPDPLVYDDMPQEDPVEKKEPVEEKK